MINHNNKIIFRLNGFLYQLKLVFFGVFCKYGLSLIYREIEKLVATKNLFVDHSKIHRWVLAFPSLLEQEFIARKKLVSMTWRTMYAIYVKVSGSWFYLDRVLNKVGQTVDFSLLKQREMQAGKTFFKKAFTSSDVSFFNNVDKSGSNKSVLDDFNQQLTEKNSIEIRQCKYLNNIVEPDHRFIKKRINPTLWFKSYERLQL